MSRRCSRSNCNEEAVATLSFQYAKAAAWLDDLTQIKEPHCYDLCEYHARRTSPPSGWRLEDRRHRHSAGSRPPDYSAPIRRNGDHSAPVRRDSTGQLVRGTNGPTERLAG